MKFTDLVPKGIFSMTQSDDAISMLVADHDKVQDLFKQFDEIKDATDARTLQKKQQIATAACSELTVHARLEEEIFYPAVRAKLDEADLLNEALVEHEGAKTLIAQLGRMTVKHEMFNARFTVLAEYVKHHINEEQSEMFPKVRAAEIDLVALGARMTARKRELTEGATPSRRRPPAKKRAVVARIPASARRKSPTRRHVASAKS